MLLLFVYLIYFLFIKMPYTNLINKIKPIGPITEQCLGIPELCTRLQTHEHSGLSDKVALLRLENHGPNQFSHQEESPAWIRFLKDLFIGFSILLWIGAALSLGVYFIEDEHNMENVYIASALVVVIFVTGAFSFYQEGKSSKVMKTFLNMIPAKAEVIRGGKTASIFAKDIVVGDIVMVKMGDQTPADMRIIESRGLKVDNSALTGESIPIAKNIEISKANYLEAPNLIFSATSIVEGEGKGVVIRTGDSTVMGLIAKLTGSIKNTQTTLARDITFFMKIIGIWSITVGLSFFAAMIILGYSWERSFIFLIGATVSSVPEGLIATLTLCLTLAAKRMSCRNCLVKKLESVETLGATSFICSDKTGTLTQNRMTVSTIWCSRRVIGFSPVYGILASERRKFEFQMLARCATLCSNANFRQYDKHTPVMQRLVDGDASETAILKFLEVATEGDVSNTRILHPKVFEVPFNSTNKFQLSIHRNKQSHLLVMKGAPEKILEKCSTILTEKDVRKMSNHESDAIKEASSAFASEGKRVLAFCDLENINFNENDADFETPKTGLRFLGLIAMLDPPRPNVPEAVLTCRKAGIKVIMVTGDHQMTARSIARQVHIISDYSRVRKGLKDSPFDGDIRKEAVVVEGSELETLSPDDLDDLITEYEEIVFARTDPKQKLEIVESCQRLGGVVAVTGDGVNDSPALKKADIGISMGISGSEVSKHAAEIVLLDDNFATVVHGIEEGRLVYDNLKKTISYTLSHNIPELFPILLHIIGGFPLPITVISILVIDLVTDMWPAVAFSYEKPESDLMLRKPRNVKTDRLVSFPLLFFVGHLGIVESVAGFFGYFCSMASFGWLPADLAYIMPDWENKSKNLTDSFNRIWTYEGRNDLKAHCSTVIFASIVVSQLANAVACMSLRYTLFQRKFTNMALKNGMLFATGFAFILVNVPGIYEVLSFRPLMYYIWFFPIPFVIIMLAWDTWRKNLIQKRPYHWLSEKLSF